MDNKNRPLSPHLQIYKPQMTSLTSIMHRMTGVYLFLGVLILSWLFIYYQYQTDLVFGNKYEGCSNATWTYVTYFFSFTWLFALYYHLCNGVRHLMWDIGKGYDIKIAYRNAYIVIFSAISLTIATIFTYFYLR
ncbi:MAG: succinate dehydrogenase / fumarate reductase cytochrome b subunit [Rickettsiales bacterium]|jgi:succinate dehydrogenase / fumarate reductase cytochrome b subunit